ncbi:MAG: trypsin-like peptidase domain-containing protein [Chthoniobacterales bacterium]
MKSILRFLVFVLIVALFVTALFYWKSAQTFKTQLGITGAVAQNSPAPPATVNKGSLAAMDAEVTQLVNHVLPSVVSIQSVAAKRSVNNSVAQLLGIPEQTPPEGQVGSGVIVSKDGYIITNVHVVQGGDSIEVILHDGQRYPATLAGSYAPADIAILKIDATNLQPLPIGNSDAVQVGQMVFAIGNPYGLQESVSHGIISAKGRRLPNESRMNEFFQTNATLSPGSSGGPLINTRGELIGINNFIFSPNGGWQGIGFAIPSNTARKIFDDIVTKGRVVSTYLGAASEWRTIPLQVVSQLHLPDNRGVLVTKVQKGSPAEEAGILPGDVIRNFNNKAISDYTDLINRVAETTPDQRIPVEVLRDNKPMTREVVIKEKPEETTVAYLPVHPPGQRTALDGIIVYDLANFIHQHNGGNENIPGVLVSSFQNAAPTATILRRGDIILQIGRQPIASLDNFRTIVKNLPPNTPQSLLVQRDNLKGWVEIDPR